MLPRAYQFIKYEWQGHQLKLESLSYLCLINKKIKIKNLLVYSSHILYPFYVRKKKKASEKNLLIKNKKEKEGGLRCVEKESWNKNVSSSMQLTT